MSVFNAQSHLFITKNCFIAILKVYKCYANTITRIYICSTQLSSLTHGGGGGQGCTLAFT